MCKEEEKRLVEVLKKNNQALGWQISDLKGISSSICMHNINLEEDFKLVAQLRRRLNSMMKEQVWKEVVKLLESGMIYAIFDSSWVSPIQVVSKKSGITMIKKDKYELIPTRTVTIWKMCIDYDLFNKETWNYHFLLPFMDQMIERLVNQAFYCFLDGYSGYIYIKKMYWKGC